MESVWRRGMAVAAGLCLLLSACAVNPPAEAVFVPAEVYVPLVTTLEPTPTPVSTPSLEALPTPNPPRGSGKFVPDGTNGLSPAQADLLVRFLTMYYEALARLETPDPAAFILAESADAVIAAARLQAVWESVVAIRQMQSVDLHLLSYEFTLTCDNIIPQEDGSIHVYLLEDSVLRFAAHPDADAAQMNVRHIVSLLGTADAPLMEDYHKADAIYGAMLERLYQEEETPERSREELLAHMQEQKKALLDEARANLAFVTAPKPVETVEAYTQEYDREAAVAYAREWVGKRNPDWFDYAQYGGNCQNFASQVLLAGGIPMDTSGSAVWKWYSDVPNQNAVAAGRSATWTGADAFFTYADENGGKGLAAVADAPFFTGAPGDLIALGLDDEIRHVVVITDVVYDENGNVIDYLIASNTTDQMDYPVSAYSYTRRRLIKIYGWN